MKHAYASTILFASAILLTSLTSPVSALAEDAVEGWLNWRGPHQTGVSDETGLPDSVSVDGDNLLWTYELKGRGTPVIAGDRVYAWGYKGEGPNLREYLVCLDANTGEEHWQLGFNDYLSDIVYSRYSIGSPTVDPETGHIYYMTTPGLFNCITPDGEILWQRSMMEEFGRLMFPNGRSGAPVIEDDLVIVRGITSNWGAQGPGRDRFYAFDKNSGALVWSSTPGTRPQDSSFSTPIFETRNGMRIMYAGTGCGHVVAMNARNGQPLWRFPLSAGGVNASPVIYEDRVIAIHGKENLDASTTGRMVAIKLGATPESPEEAPLELGQAHELWRAELEMFTSSPTLVDDKIYQVVKTGELYCVDANTGEVLWTEKLSNSQLHASPVYADGKLYIPLVAGLFYIIEPTEDGAEILSRVEMEGDLIGSPAICDGKIYQFTTERLYVWGENKSNIVQERPEPEIPEAGETADLRVVPAEVMLRPGAEQTFTVTPVDAHGFETGPSIETSDWQSYIPPTARVQARMEGEFTRENTLAIPEDAELSAGAFQVAHEDLTGTFRGRVLPDFPYQEDFEDFELTEEHPTLEDVNFAYPPLPWIGARVKWEIREVNGNKALTKTLDRVLFQRAISFIGHPQSSNYTIQADVMTDGDRRMRSSPGVINQRYIIMLDGNWQQLRVISNMERINESVPFRWQPNKWYTLKARVDLHDDGSGVIRGKAWPQGEPEPEEWNIEVTHQIAHKEGAPGVYGFSPQSQYSCYIDNIVVTKNQD